jgi:hypothetical protein
MSYLAFRNRDHESVNPIPPAVGTVGASGFFVLMLWHLYRAERATFVAVLLIAGAVLFVETLYFERDTLESEIASIEEVLDNGLPSVGD